MSAEERHRLKEVEKQRVENANRLRKNVEDLNAINVEVALLNNIIMNDFANQSHRELRITRRRRYRPTNEGIRNRFLSLESKQMRLHVISRRRRAKFRKIEKINTRMLELIAERELLRKKLDNHNI